MHECCNHLHFHRADGALGSDALAAVAAVAVVDSHDLVMNCMDPLGYCVVAVVMDAVVAVVALVAHNHIEPLEPAAGDGPCVAFAFDDFVERFDDVATIDCGALTYSYYCNRFDLDSVAICMHS